MLGDISDEGSGDSACIIILPDVSSAVMFALVRALYTGRLEAPSKLRPEVTEAVALFNESLGMLKAFACKEDAASTTPEDTEVIKVVATTETGPADKMVVAETSEVVLDDGEGDRMPEPAKEENVHDVREIVEHRTPPQTQEEAGSTTPTSQRSKRNRSAVKRFIELDDDDFGQKKRKRSENKPAAAAAAVAVKVEDTPNDDAPVCSLPKMADRPNFAEAAKGEWRQRLSLLGPLQFVRWLLENGFLNSAVGPCEECSSPLELTTDPDAPAADRARWSCPNRSKNRR